ncbi:MAG: hypothetical protein RBT65_01025 [Methanolobus sp.]|nr:hypothetical protein [Methanolobus sp.]
MYRLYVRGEQNWYVTNESQLDELVALAIQYGASKASLIKATDAGK